MNMLHMELFEWEFSFVLAHTPGGLVNQVEFLGIPLQLEHFHLLTPLFTNTGISE